MIVSRVQGAVVQLDGEMLDALRLGQATRVTEGRHELVAIKEALLTQRRAVRLEAREDRAFKPRFRDRSDHGTWRPRPQDAVRMQGGNGATVMANASSSPTYGATIAYLYRALQQNCEFPTRSGLTRMS